MRAGQDLYFGNEFYATGSRETIYVLFLNMRFMRFMHETGRNTSMVTDVFIRLRELHAMAARLKYLN